MVVLRKKKSISNEKDFKFIYKKRKMKTVIVET